MFKILAVIYFCTLQVLAESLITYKLPITNELKQALGYTEGSYLNFTERTSSFGYSSEQHSVTTEDGYILTFFRTSSPNCTQLKTYPTLLIHGIFGNSDSFLEVGVNASLVYLLANQCYDVWVANLRGDDYSRAHTSLNPDTDAAFWKYSIDEFGYYDVPATVDYILNNTGVAKLNIIGFSSGGTSPIVMGATRPSYTEKINLLVGIAPPTRINHVRSITFRYFLLFFTYFRTILQTIGFEEVFGKGGVVQVILEYICNYIVGLSPQILGLLDGYNPGSVSALTSRVIFSHFFVGSSVQQLAMAGQNIENDVFRRFDYGAAENLVKYGNETAPAYNLSNVTIPTLLLAGLGDPVVPAEDVLWLGQQLNNTLEVVKLSDRLWTHLDNTFSQNIPTVQYPPIKKYLDMYNP